MKNVPFCVLQNAFDRQLMEMAHRAWPTDGWGGTATQLKQKKKRSMTDIPEGPLAELHQEGLKLKPFLEQLWGIHGLRSDPNNFGSGLHETLPGGSLGMHVDFNSHDIGGFRHYRRVNVLLYLNHDWKDDDGGHLFVGRDRQCCVVPEFGTLVTFPTSHESWHGHPIPVSRNRRSMAWYWYTEAKPLWFDRPRSTVYEDQPKPRPFQR